jgi:hypothetical protein
VEEAIQESDLRKASKSAFPKSSPMPGLEPQCQCADDEVVNGIHTGKEGCDQHFGRRFGYLCYIPGGAECTFAKQGKVGVYYRPCPAERKRDEAQMNLLETLEGIDPDAVTEMAEKAKEAHVGQEVLDLAEKRRKQILEMLEVREDLLVALEGFDKDTLKKLAIRADELELFEFMDHEVEERIEKRYKFLSTKDDKEHDLKKAMSKVDLEDLQECIERAIAVKADEELVKKGQQREVELKAQRKQIKEDLLEAIDGWDVDKLKALAEEAEDHKTILDELPKNVPDRIENRVKFLESAGKKEATLRKCMQDVDLAALQAAIKDVEDVRGDQQLLAAGKTREKELTEELRKGRSDMDAALKSLDLDFLKSALEEVRRLRIVTDNDEEVAKGRSEYLEILEGDSMGDVMRAIAAHEQDGTFPDITEKAVERKKELARIMHNQKKKIQALIEESNDPDEIERELQEGLRIRCVSRALREDAEKRIAELRR